MNQQDKPDDELIEAIKKGGNTRQKALEYIYHRFEAREQIIRYVCSNNGTLDQAKDIFHDAMITLDRNIREKKFRGEGSLNSYLHSIGRFLWLKRLQKEGRIVLPEDESTLDKIIQLTPEDIAIRKNLSELLEKFVAKLDERCQKVLELWKLHYSMEEIAKMLGFSSADMAKKQRYRCHKRLMKALLADPQLRNLINQNKRK